MVISNEESKPTPEVDKNLTVVKEDGKVEESTPENTVKVKTPGQDARKQIFAEALKRQREGR